MKKIVFSILFFIATYSYAGSLSEASVEELKVLTTYVYDQFGSDARLSNVLDDDTLKVESFLYMGEEYKMLIVYSGDTPHGPVYNPDTLEIVGEMSDGDILINGSYIDYEDVVYIED